jgi:hypothetical protein
VASEEDKRYNPHGSYKAMSTLLLTPTAESGIADSTAREFFQPNKVWGTSAAEVRQRYEAIVNEPRYFQFANIPERIIRCLESGATVSQPETMRARLLAYYLFIGVVDDEIESGALEAGERTLSRLANPLPCFDQETRDSKSQFMTEVLKLHIDPLIRAEVLSKFRDLHQSSVAEREAVTMNAYVAQRKLVGRLTAEISYLLIRELISSERIDCCRMMRDVGAVGCLVDSIIDRQADERGGALSFRARWSDLFRLCAGTTWDGTKLIFKYPRLLSLFADALRDNFRDRRRPLAR